MSKELWTQVDRYIESALLPADQVFDHVLSATAIQTVGVKGYDGFAIALVN